MSTPGGGPDPADVRRAFRRVATNVAVLTTLGPHGCTANVWAEAPDPPVLLVTLRRGGDTHAAVVGAGRFAVHVLADDQQPLARRFAGEARRRFEDLDYETGPLELPWLGGALVRLACTVCATHWFGAHEIVVGDVCAVDVADTGRPLLFGDGRFGALAR